MVDMDQDLIDRTEKLMKEALKVKDVLVERVVMGDGNTGEMNHLDIRREVVGEVTNNSKWYEAFLEDIKVWTEEMAKPGCRGDGGVKHISPTYCCVSKRIGAEAFDLHPDQQD